MSGDSLQKIKEYRVRNIRTAQRAQGKRRMRVFQKPDTDLYPGSMEAKACLTIHGPVTHCSALCWASWVCACGVSRSSAGGMPDSRSFPAGRRSHSLTKKFPSLSLVRGGMGESSGGAELRPTGKQRSPRRVTESGVTGVAERKTVFQTGFLKTRMMPVSPGKTAPAVKRKEELPASGVSLSSPDSMTGQRSLRRLCTTPLPGSGSLPALLLLFLRVRDRADGVIRSIKL